ncbi:MAG: outer membrane homotrimeric porin [Desulfovibrionaceae bacterium]|nr:outer membrane homotrimeric porin [Desulfovibrionaceae bacterium]
MRKLLSLIVAGGLLAASASAASAVDIKVKGQFNFGFGLYDGLNFTKHDGDENFYARQMLRTQVDFIASESLKGVFQIEVGEVEWGGGSGATWGGPAAGRGAGGAKGADGVSVEVKHMYLDWLVPNTDLQVRMGIQPFANPHAIFRGDYKDGGAIIDDDVAGILLSYNFNENVGANLGWFRPWDGSVSGDGSNYRPVEGDEVDMFFLSLPIEVKDSFSLTPWGMYALIGDDLGPESWGNAANPFGYITTGYLGNAESWLSANGSLGEDGKAWWTGLAFELTEFDPFVAGLDFTYGRYSADNAASSPFVGGDGFSNETDRDGWIITAKLAYKLDHFTPALIGWYGSGADLDGNKGFDGLIPSLAPYWGMTSFGFVGVNLADIGEGIIGADPGGTWGISLALEDIRFVDNLTSYLRFAYYRGTSDAEEYNKAARAAGALDAFRAFEVLDTSDWAFEVNLDNIINIYDNLDMFVDLAYIRLDVAEAGDDFEKNAWKGFVGFQYTF